MPDYEKQMAEARKATDFHTVDGKLLYNFHEIERSRTDAYIKSLLDERERLRKIESAAKAVVEDGQDCGCTCGPNCKSCEDANRVWGELHAALRSPESPEAGKDGR